jgi:hypothetical protein
MMTVSVTMDIAFVRVVHQRMPNEHSVVVPNKTSVCNYVLSEMLVIEIYDTLDITMRLY